MPHRAVAAREMASLLGVLAHPHRVRIIEVLRTGEMDVNSLQDILEVSHSRVSQHLSVMRSHRIVTERREGRHVFYRLQQPGMAQWLMNGLVFLSMEQQIGREIREAVESTLQLWSNAENEPRNANGTTPHPTDRDVTN
jgi:DNA-binding transcriptional ArsR family regulator